MDSDFILRLLLLSESDQVDLSAEEISTLATKGRELSQEDLGEVFLLFKDLETMDVSSLVNRLDKVFAKLLHC